MTFEDTIKLIPDLKIHHVKIVDTAGKKVMELNGESPENLLTQLEGYRSILSTSGRLKFIAANESMFKQNFKDAYNWDVVFTAASHSNNSTPTTLTHAPSGYVSSNEANLLAELKALQMQRDFDLKLVELNKKIDDKGSDGFDKYLPMLGMIVDIDDKKMKNMMALGALQSSMNGSPATGLAGLEKKPHVQTTVEEKELINNLNDEMGKLAQKVDLSAIVEFVKTLNDKPEFLTLLLQMAKTHKS